MVVENEKSYISKASFIDRDIMPTYKKNFNKDYTFSGKRLKRGLISKNKLLYINNDLIKNYRSISVKKTKGRDKGCLSF